MSDYLSTFPTRPLRFTRTGIVPGFFSYLGALLLLAVFAFIAYFQAPGVIRDVAISRDPVIAYDADVRNGECTSRQAIFVDCSADVSYVVKGKAQEAAISLMFVDFHSGDYQVEVVYSESQPRLATLSLGLDMLWNRIIVGLLFLGAIAIGAVALFLQGMRADKARRLARQPRVQKAVEVEITGISKFWGGQRIEYATARPGKKRPLQTTVRFRKREVPFFTGDDNTALALLPAGGTVPVLLDDALERVDLTTAERMSIRAARDKATTAA